MEDQGHQAMWPQMIAALAAIDAALGLPEDGCNSTQQTLDAIAKLKADATKSERRAITFGDIVAQQTMETQKPMAGTWTLTAPDGRQWQAESPMRCVSVEQRDRVPADVALARVLAAASEPDFADRHVQLGRFYAAANTDELIDALEQHVAKLQQRLSDPGPAFPAALRRSRVS